MVSYSKDSKGGYKVGQEVHYHSSSKHAKIEIDSFDGFSRKSTPNSRVDEKLKCRSALELFFIILLVSSWIQRLIPLHHLFKLLVKG